MALLPKPVECTSCQLYGNGMGFSRPEGTGTLGVLVMAEALGEEEERDGLPLRPYAQSGSMFERIIKMCGYSRQQFVIYNTVNCRPPRNWLEGSPWEASAISHCRTHRERVIDGVKPRVILAMGGVACRTMTGEAGEKRGISYLRGYVMPALKGYKQGQVPCTDCMGKGGPCFLCDGSGMMDSQLPEYSDLYVMPTFHPAFIQRGEKRMIGVVAHDIRKAVQLSQQLLLGNKPIRHAVDYQTNATLDQARSFLLRAQENQGALLAYDIETPSSASEDEDIREIGDDDDENAKPKKYPQDYALSDDESTIIQVQFSLGPYTGIAFPWQGEFIHIARLLLAMNHRKAGWNISTFDDPRLIAAGCRINGVREDFMWKWHHLQPDLPAGLQFACSFLGMDFPWKHLYAESLDWYGCADVDAVQRADIPLQADLDKLGIARGYERHIKALTPILQETAARGFPVNREKLAAFDHKIALAQEEVRSTKIMPKVEGLNLGKIDPKQGLKTANAAELKKLLADGNSPEAISQIRLSHIDAKGKESFYRFELRDFADTKPLADVNAFVDAIPATPMVKRWCRHYEFNPNSADQLKEYMKAKKHPIPKDFKSDAETTNKQELIRLSKKVKDTFYLEIIEFREFSKMRATYCKGWMPKADGCVHTTWTYRPATGQLSSVDPNIQNAPKHAELAKEFRDCIEAPPNHKIVEFDFKSFHALTLGFEARDPDYMRLARMDIHSYVAAHLLRLPDRDRLITMADDELMARLGEVKKAHKFVRDKKAKPTILGYGFGLGYRKLFQMNRESFTGEKDAKSLIELLDHLFPRTCAFREAIKHQAQKAYRLVSRHGYHRRFHDVLDFWGMGRIENAARLGRKVPPVCSICKQRHDNGEEAEQAIAFLPANDAFGHIKDNILALGGVTFEKDGVITYQRDSVLDRGGFGNTVHDSLVFIMPDSTQDELIPTIFNEMVKPSNVLVDDLVAPAGLICDVEISIGQTWKTLETISVTTGMAASA